jgi:prepilin-type processing-associated H-X9-DG protein
VELLVVIGIISVLIGLLLPTFAKARQQSRIVTCRAQLQNIGSALQVYLNDNSGCYPPAPYSPTFNPDRAALLSEYLAKYVVNTPKVFACPADAKYFPQYGLSYSYYQELGVRPIAQTHFFKVLRAVAHVPVLWDAESFHGGDVPANWLFADGHVDDFFEEIPAAAAAAAPQRAATTQPLSSR